MTTRLDDDKCPDCNHECEAETRDICMCLVDGCELCACPAPAEDESGN